MAYQPHSSMTVSAAFVADVDSWLRRVGRVGRLLFPLLPLYSFMHRSILLSSSRSCLYDCSPVPTIICGCLPCRSVDSRHFHVAFACISVAEIRMAYCTRSRDELTIQLYVAYTPVTLWKAGLVWIVIPCLYPQLFICPIILYYSLLPVSLPLLFPFLSPMFLYHHIPGLPQFPLFPIILLSPPFPSLSRLSLPQFRRDDRLHVCHDDCVCGPGGLHQHYDGEQRRR